jgi:hypothetical protein
MKFETTQKPKLPNIDFIDEKVRLFNNIKTKADDLEYLWLISNITDEFRQVLNEANVLNEGHANIVETPNINDAFRQQFNNDLYIVNGAIEFVEFYGRDKITKRHWNIAQQMFNRYSFSGDIYQSIGKTDMSDASRLKMVMAINSLLKNIDIYLKEKHFYEFYELCRATFEPDSLKTEDNTISEVDSTK